MTEPQRRESDLVSFSMKELLEKIDRKVDRIASSLDQKADRQTVEAIEHRLNQVADRVLIMEQQHRGDVKDIADLGTAVAQVSTRLNLLPLPEKLSELDDRIDKQENFTARLIGIALGVSVASGGIAAAVTRAVSGG